jgi:hypothetical protein
MSRLAPAIVAVLALLTPAQCLATQVTLVSVDGKRPVLVLPSYTLYCDYLSDVNSAPDLDAAQQIATQKPYNALTIQPGSRVQEIGPIVVTCKNGAKLQLVQVMPLPGAAWRGPGYVPPDAIQH